MSYFHSIRTVERARAMVKAGWSYSATAQAVGASDVSVRRWCNPEVEEANRARARAQQAARPSRATRPPSGELLLQRAVRLRDAGVSYTAIAAVFRVLYGVDVDGEQVRWRVNKRRWSRPRRKVAA